MPWWLVPLLFVVCAIGFVWGSSRQRRRTRERKRRWCVIVEILRQEDIDRETLVRRAYGGIDIFLLEKDIQELKQLGVLEYWGSAALLHLREPHQADLVLSLIENA